MNNVRIVSSAFTTLNFGIFFFLHLNSVSYQIGWGIIIAICAGVVWNWANECISMMRDAAKSFSCLRKKKKKGKKSKNSRTDENKDSQLSPTPSKQDLNESSNNLLVTPSPKNRVSKIKSPYVPSTAKNLDVNQNSSLPLGKGLQKKALSKVRTKKKRKRRKRRN